jgi:hypothetical protein
MKVTVTKNNLVLADMEIETIVLSLMMLNKINNKVSFPFQITVTLSNGESETVTLYEEV